MIIYEILKKIGIFLIKHWKLFVIIFLSLLVVLFYRKYNNALDKNSILANNNKALFSENKKLNTKNYQYELSIKDLKYYNDSINTKLDSIIKSNNIKTKDLTQVQYIKTVSSKTDTIIYRDTLFVPKLNLDTLLVKDGYTLRLELKYPNEIITTPTFINEEYVLFSNKKETIDPPKKFFLLRWFQKKQIVVTVDVINNNKYSNIQSKRFIKIIK